MADPDSYLAASAAACDQAAFLQRVADETLEEFIEQFTGQPAPEDATARKPREPSVPS
jgi:transcriptional regulator of met regulon